MTPRRAAVRRLAAAALGIATLPGLPGCASRPPADAAAPWTSGRLVLRIAAAGEQAARSVSASFDLRGDADHGELRLASSIGVMLAQARWTPRRAWLATSDGERDFDDLDALSREALGEALPLRALPDWLAGRPWPGAPSRTAAAGFEQLGWRIRTAQLADGLIEAERDAPPAVTLRVRLERS